MRSPPSASKRKAPRAAPLPEAAPLRPTESAAASARPLAAAVQPAAAQALRPPKLAAKPAQGAAAGATAGGAPQKAVSGWDAAIVLSSSDEEDETPNAAADIDQLPPGAPQNPHC